MLKLIIFFPLLFCTLGVSRGNPVLISENDPIVGTWLAAKVFAIDPSPTAEPPAPSGSESFAAGVYMEVSGKAAGPSFFGQGYSIAWGDKNGFADNGNLLMPDFQWKACLWKITEQVYARTPYLNGKCVEPVAKGTLEQWVLSKDGNRISSTLVTASHNNVIQEHGVYYRARKDFSWSALKNYICKWHSGNGYPLPGEESFTRCR